MSQLPNGTNKVMVALCCTHYGYCGAEMLSEVLATAGRKDVEVVNPNEKMAHLLFALGNDQPIPHLSASR